MTIRDYEFRVWWDGSPWAASCDDLGVLEFGDTALSAMMSAERACWERLKR